VTGGGASRPSMWRADIPTLARLLAGLWLFGVGEVSSGIRTVSSGSGTMKARSGGRVWLNAAALKAAGRPRAARGFESLPLRSLTVSPARRIGRAARGHPGVEPPRCPRRGRTSPLSCLGVGMRAQGRTAEQEIARIARTQHGVVTRAQLLTLGVSPAGISRRVRKGALHRAHRGVYRVGHCAPSIEARYLAAVYACGREALLCGRAAAHLQRLLKGPPPGPEVATTAERRIPGVRTLRSRRDVDRRDAAVLDRIPVTKVPRTLVDLAAALTLDELARACHEAGVLHGTTPAQVEAVLARRPNSPGAANLRRVLRGDVRVVLSRIERRFLELLRQSGLPLPRTNRPAGARRVDCRWPEQRLTVELDGYRYHRSRHAWEQDRRREREARARGDEFRRYTYGDVVEHPRLMLDELRVLLPAQVGSR
jgi:very-short-patch-repair endonuclease